MKSVPVKYQFITTDFVALTKYQNLVNGSFTQAIWVGNFAQRCNFKIEKSVSNRNRQQQVLIVLTPV